MNTDDVVRALISVPEKRLRLIELTREIVAEDGSIDPKKVSFYRKELDEAVAEAEAYARETNEAVRCLRETLHS